MERKILFLMCSKCGQITVGERYKLYNQRLTILGHGKGPIGIFKVVRDDCTVVRLA